MSYCKYSRDEAIGLIIQYDPAGHEALKRLRHTRIGYREEIGDIQKRIDDGEPGVRFSITDDNGDILIEGTFYGSDRDRDWPLESTRISAGDVLNPVRIEYADGKAFIYDMELDAVLPA